MRCVSGLVAFLGVALAAPAADFEYPEAFRQPKPSEKTHLRRALDPDHAANKVYPPDPEEKIVCSRGHAYHCSSTVQRCFRRR